LRTVTVDLLARGLRFGAADLAADGTEQSSAGGFFDFDSPESNKNCLLILSWQGTATAAKGCFNLVALVQRCVFNSSYM
jgi:hypothetical protein